ncbi:amidohydrolase family protein [Microbacterium sp. MAHUQ-60]|uniref:amidohydrolase family protein n=1 Tax=unclassified Microbacterium TaxID=2609290 RepID=UPI0036235FC9
MIVDAHHHAWDGSAPLTWMVGAYAALRRPARLQDHAIEASAVGVQASVLVEGGAPACAEQGARALLGLADASSMVTATVIGLPTAGLADASLGALLDELGDAPGGDTLAGVRWGPVDAEASWAGSEKLAHGAEVLASRDLALDLLVRSDELSGVTTLARRHPNLRIVLDHLAKPPVAAGDGREEWDAWSEGMAAASRCSNVFVKVSGLVQRSPVAHRMTDAIEAVAENFGTHRLMLGSDWPVCTLAASFHDTWDLYTSLFSGFSPAERQRVLGGTAREVYRMETS